MSKIVPPEPGNGHELARRQPEVPPLMGDLGGMSSEIERQLEREKGADKTYYDMVPGQYRRFVDGMTRDAAPHFQIRAESTEYGQLKEAMSFNWLMKVRLFDHVGQALGMQPTSSVMPAEDTPILALTSNASLLYVSEPRDGEGNRETHYSRINIREPTHIQPMGSGKLLSMLNVGERGEVKGFIYTSTLMDLRIQPRNLADVRPSVMDMATRFRNIDRQTVVDMVAAPKRKEG
ncbi:hypothetical protein ACFLRF_01305 [Candidatus Altiarchaeota archaeon]